MKHAEVLQRIRSWGHPVSPPATPCPHCGPVHVSIQEQVGKLAAHFERLACMGEGHAVYRCPGCGQFWEYRSWMERPDWGECMEGQTEPYEVEALYKRTRAQVESLVWAAHVHDPKGLVWGER